MFTTEYTPTNQMLADMNTKALTGKKFQLLPWVFDNDEDDDEMKEWKHQFQVVLHSASVYFFIGL